MREVIGTRGLLRRRARAHAGSRAKYHAAWAEAKAAGAGEAVPFPDRPLLLAFSQARDGLSRVRSALPLQ